MFSVMYSRLCCYFFQGIRLSVVARACLLCGRKPLFKCAQYKRSCECGFGIFLPAARPLYRIVLRYTKERGRHMLVKATTRNTAGVCWMHMFLLWCSRIWTLSTALVPISKWLLSWFFLAMYTCECFVPMLIIQELVFLWKKIRVN